MPFPRHEVETRSAKTLDCRHRPCAVVRLDRPFCENRIGILFLERLREISQAAPWWEWEGWGAVAFSCRGIALVWEVQIVLTINALREDGSRLRSLVL